MDDNVIQQEHEESISLIEKLRDQMIVETEDQVYYDGESPLTTDEQKDQFIRNIKAQMVEEEKEIFENLKYTDAETLTAYLDNDDETHLVEMIIAAAYCTFYGIEIDDDTREVVECQEYCINDCRDFYYEYETDIDLG